MKVSLVIQDDLEVRTDYFTPCVMGNPCISESQEGKSLLVQTTCLEVHHGTFLNQGWQILPS